MRAVWTLLTLLFALVLAGCGGSGGTYSPSAGEGGGGPATPGFTISIDPPVATQPPFQAARYTVTLRSQNGFSEPVALSLPDFAGLSEVAQNPVVPTSGGTSTQLTVRYPVQGELPAFVDFSVVATGGGLTRQATARLLFADEGS